MGKIMYLIERLKATGEPITLSINGRGANLSVSDDGAFQLLFDLVERLEVTEMLRERLAELARGMSDVQCGGGEGSHQGESWNIGIG